MSQIPPTITGPTLAIACALVLAMGGVPSFAQDTPPPVVLPLPAENIDLPVEVIASYPAGTFLEGLAFAPDGTLLVSVGTEGEIVRVEMDGTVETVARLPLALGGLGAEIAGTLVIAGDGTIYPTAIVPGGTGPNNGVWRIDADGSSALLAKLPDGAIANGIAMGPEGDLYTADSVGGRIFRVDRDRGTATVWVADDRLAARSGSIIPGINGIAYWNSAFTVSVPDRGIILNIDRKGDGTAGAFTVIAEVVPGDGIALDTNGAVYATTHPFNTVTRVTPDGQRQTIATAEDGIVGPTDVAFGVSQGDEGSLYVVTDGGLFESLMIPGTPLQDALVLRIQTGRTGAHSGWRIAGPYNAQ